MIARTLHAAWSATRRYRLVLVVVVALCVVFAVSQPEFLTLTNIKNLLANSAVLWIVAVGMTFVLLTGGFDLSVGATATLSGIIMAKLIGLGLPGGVALLVTVLGGAGIGGLLNGFPVGRLGLSVFVVTLATMIGLTGVVNLWSGANSFLVTAPVVSALGVNNLLGWPTPIWVMAAILVMALYLQARTYFGRDVYAVGGSRTAARLAGIRVPRTLMWVYAFVGACAALAGVITVGRVGAATPTVDPTLPLQAIAAVLLGGTALTGGLGGVTGTALGVLFIAILQNGLGLAGVSSNWQSVVTAVILIVAVGGDRVRVGGSLRSLRPARLGRAGRGLAPDAAPEQPA